MASIRCRASISITLNLREKSGRVGSSIQYSSKSHFEKNETNEN